MFCKPEETARRKVICDQCEHKKGIKCGVCGCFLIALQNTTFGKCKLDKWNTVTVIDQTHKT
jgi:hypothetical protein